MYEQTAGQALKPLGFDLYAAVGAALLVAGTNARSRMRKFGDGEQNVATVLLIVITIGVGVLLFHLAKNNLKPVIEDAGRNLNNYASEGQTWTTPTRP